MLDFKTIKASLFGLSHDLPDISATKHVNERYLGKLHDPEAHGQWKAPNGTIWNETEIVALTTGKHVRIGVQNRKQTRALANQINSNAYFAPKVK